MFQTPFSYAGTIEIPLLLASGASFRQVRKGDLIFSEGSACWYYYQLVSGSVRWVNIDDDGRTYVQAFIEPGECFGELPLFDEGPYASSAFAEKDSMYIRLKKETFSQLMAEQPELLMIMSRLLAHRLREKFFMLKSIANPSPEVRLVRLLEYLKNSGRHIVKETNQIRLTRQQIADLSGLRVETVIRTMKHMHLEGLLRIENRKIFL
jgi:CRP/FNR family transcriptional regulator, cyclic AMP receptor protein